MAKEEARSSSLRPQAHRPAFTLHRIVLALSSWVLLSWPHWGPAQGQIMWEHSHMAPALSSLFLGKSMRWPKGGQGQAGQVSWAGDHGGGRKWLL